MTLKITWLGTAAYILDLDATRLMFDPFFFRNNSKATPILKTNKESIKDLNAIFISHGHFDHAIDAAWFAENFDVPVYCSETAKENMIRWAKGNISNEHSHPLSERGRNNLKIIDYFDKITINENVYVEVIKSKHIVFDSDTINTRTNSEEFMKQTKNLAKYSGGFLKGKVFGFCTFFKDKKIVSFGSLYHKNAKLLEKYKNCDILLIPLAGNSAENLALKGGILVNNLKPKTIIPYHHDDFFPPISRTENLEPFYEIMRKNHPEIKILNLEIDEETIIE